MAHETESGTELTASERRGVLWALCLTEIVSWGVLYYAFAVLGHTIAEDTGWSLARLTALFSAALIVSGGASNLIDRVITGSVIDFLNVGIGPLRTGIFNAADVGIMVGAGLMGYAVYREPRGRAGCENGIRSQS